MHVDPCAVVAPWAGRWVERACARPNNVKSPSTRPGTGLEQFNTMCRFILTTYRDGLGDRCRAHRGAPSGGDPAGGARRRPRWSAARRAHRSEGARSRRRHRDKEGLRRSALRRPLHRVGGRTRSTPGCRAPRERGMLPRSAGSGLSDIVRRKRASAAPERHPVHRYFAGAESRRPNEPNARCGTLPVRVVSAKRTQRERAPR